MTSSLRTRAVKETDMRRSLCWMPTRMLLRIMIAQPRQRVRNVVLGRETLID